MASGESEPDQPPTAGQQASTISNALVRIQRDYIGRGPNKVRTSIRDDAVLVLLQETLTKAERSLVAQGREEQVLGMRHSFQDAMGPAMIDAVHEATGREVIAFMSDNHIDPDIASEIFVLAPEHPDGDGADDPRVA